MKHRIVSIYAILAVLAGTAGCQWLRTGTDADDTPEDPGLISRDRAAVTEKSREFICLYPAANVYSDPVPDTPEIRLLRERAASAGYRIVFLAAAPDEIPAKLRAGKGDIAAGDYTASYAASRYLGAVPSGEKTVFLVRADDPLCPELLHSVEK